MNLAAIKTDDLNARGMALPYGHPLRGACFMAAWKIAQERRGEMATGFARVLYDLGHEERIYAVGGTSRIEGVEPLSADALAAVAFPL